MTLITSIPISHDPRPVLMISGPRNGLGFAFAAVLIFGSPGLGQDNSRTPAVHGAIKSGVEDDREFELNGQEREREGAGGLKYGGFCGNQASHISARYSAPPKAEVTVQVMHHAPEYQYVIHDFYGAFLAMGEDMAKQAKRKGRATGEVPPHSLINFLEWILEPSATPSILVYLNDISEESLHGNIGWFGQQNGRLVTVLIGFKYTNGLPRKVIDAYLAKVPSRVESGEADLSHWIEKDIAKWIALLKTRGSESFVLQSAALRLQRYAREPFVMLDPLLKKSGSPEQFQKALAKYIERVEKWAGERDQRGASGTPHE